MVRKIALTLFVLILFVWGNAQEEKSVVSAKIFDNRVEITYDIPGGYHQILQKDYFFFDVEPVDGITFSEIEYPSGDQDAEGNIVYHDKVILVRKFTVEEPISVNSIKIIAAYQFCLESGSCLFPEEVEIELPYPADPIDTASEDKTKPESILVIIQYLLMAFAGGVILNVMPCVLPVLSIKAMSLVKQSQQDHRQILKNSLAYTAGILTSFIVLALIIVILKMSGELVGWGFQFQSPGFVTALLILIFVFSLSLFDLFIIRAPGMQTATKAASKGGLTGAFLSGIFAVLLATPCTAPLLGAALGFAFSQPPAMIFGIFILIGIGLAFPFIILGFWPKAIKAIPKPGEWMNIFKEAMGFLLLLTALYLLRSLYFLIGGNQLINVILYLIILAFAAWIYGRFARPEFSSRKQWIASLLALIIAVGAGFITLDYHTTQEGQITEDTAHYPRDWQKFSPDLVEKYRNENKPVFIDFGAEWCLTCKTNETAVLFTEDIESAFKSYGVEMLRGDNTKKDDTIGEWLRRFNRAGVPLYILYIPGQDEPEVLPELITKDMVLNLLKKLDK